MCIEFLKHLSTTGLQQLLRIYNYIWESHQFPTEWKLAIVIPIPKHGQTSNELGNIRPVSLTSALCKLMEIMVNRRLVWIIEQQGLLTPHRFGFRQKRSTVDALSYISNKIQFYMQNKAHVLAVFFDLQKAFDTTWRRKILNALCDWSIKLEI